MYKRQILGKAAKAAPAAKTAVKKLPVTGTRKKMIFKDGSPAEKAAALAEALKADGYDFSVGIDIDTPIIAVSYTHLDVYKRQDIRYGTGTDDPYILYRKASGRRKGRVL